VLFLSQDSRTSCKVLDYDLENSRTWKVMENHWSWKVLEINALGFGKSWKNILEFYESFS